MNSISTKNLTKYYGDTIAVDHIELDVKQGQVFGFLGPNGAGKSTTIKLLTTLIPPSEGNLVILGTDAIRNPLVVRNKIGVVLQQPSYEPTLSVEKSLEKYGMMWGVPKSIRKNRMEELIEDFDLADIRKKRNEDLSIGQRRRVQVAREFMHDMELLFLDEPTVGLDPTARRKLLDYLKNKAKTGLTIFYTTHVLSEAEYLCDEIAIINKGKIIMIDSPDSLKKKFGQTKTLKIRVSRIEKQIIDLLSNIQDCNVDFQNKTSIIIHSEKSEVILLKIFKILHEHEIEIEEISVIPTTLEEIFLKMVNNDASNI